MSWQIWNNRKAHLEDVRMAFRQYVMADLAGDLDMKMRAVKRLKDLGEMPRPALSYKVRQTYPYLPDVPAFKKTLELQKTWDAWLESKGVGSCETTNR